MSKKTLYKHFCSKEALLMAVIRTFAVEISGGIDRILEAVQILESTINIIYEGILSENGRLHLQKYPPNSVVKSIIKIYSSR